jgi:hypothetical protein
MDQVDRAVSGAGLPEGVPMISWFGRKSSNIPDGMVQLRLRPIGDHGANVWTDEIEHETTRRFSGQFIAPALYETSPGQ